MALLKNVKMNDRIRVFIRLNEGLVKPEIWACNDNTLMYGLINETLMMKNVDLAYYGENYKSKLDDGYFFAGSLEIGKFFQPEWPAFLNFWFGKKVSQLTFEIMHADKDLRYIADEICRCDPLAESDPKSCKSAPLRKRMADMRISFIGTGINLDPENERLKASPMTVLDASAHIKANPSFSW